MVLPLLLTLLGCPPVALQGAPDADGDGFADEVDCDDAQAASHAGADEVCDGLDNDCDGSVDEDPVNLRTWYVDADGDGHGDPGAPVQGCTPPPGTLVVGDDCDDARGDVFPGAPEHCDGIDQDCDRAVDEDPVDAPLWYVDADGDGHGDPARGTARCGAGEGEVALGDDCDDASAAVYPGAPESDCTDPVDYNCDGSAARADADADGWAACEDCNDADAAVRRDAAEVCDGSVDEDCDGLVDDADPGVTGTVTWYTDADADGWGADATRGEGCVAPAGTVGSGGDCDDADPLRAPDLPEVCDGADVDEDCDTLADDLDPSVVASTRSLWGQDLDGDGHGNPAVVLSRCDAPAGYAAALDDCDDTSATVSPSAAEVCDAGVVDEDCDGAVDDADPDVTGTTRWYADADGDGWGDPAVEATSCAGPAGYVDNHGDCDDTDATVAPDGATPCAVRFLVLGDTGDGSLNQYAVADGMEIVCGTVPCDFVMLVGDNFYPGGVTSTKDPLWTDAFELPYAAVDLQFRAVMGNHDWNHTQDPMYLDAQVDYSSVSSKWSMPSDWYTFEEGDITFYGIDTWLITEGVGADQEAWLPAARAASTSTWNLVFGHHPFLSNGPHGNADPALEDFVTDHVCGAFDVYFCGHDHNLQWLEDSCGTAFIVSGGGHGTYGLSGSNPTHFEAESLGFLWVEIDGNTFTGVFYDETGTELYRRSFTK